MNGMMKWNSGMMKWNWNDELKRAIKICSVHVISNLIKLLKNSLSEITNYNHAFMFQSTLYFHLHQVQFPTSYIFFTFNNRKTKPESCPKCRCPLGGQHVAKAPPAAKSKSGDGDVVAVAPGVYSVRYHQHHRYT